MSYAKLLPAIIAATSIGVSGCYIHDHDGRYYRDRDHGHHDRDYDRDNKRDHKDDRDRYERHR